MSVTKCVPVILIHCSHLRFLVLSIVKSTKDNPQNSSSIAEVKNAYITVWSLSHIKTKTFKTMKVS